MFQTFELVLKYTVFHTLQKKEEKSLNISLNTCESKSYISIRQYLSRNLNCSVQPFKNVSKTTDVI